MHTGLGGSIVDDQLMRRGLALPFVQMRAMKPAARQACDQHMEQVARCFADIEEVDEDDVSDLVFDDLAGVGRTGRVRSF
jgi:hypothetical protein